MAVGPYHGARTACSLGSGDQQTGHRGHDKIASPAMNIGYYHASKFGNGAMVAEEFKKIMAARGVNVTVRHVRDADPGNLQAADLYVFSSPGRMGKPRGNVRRFLRRGNLEPGTRYAILTTQGAPRP